MTLNLIVRRTHLYLGLLVAPWMLMYGLSSAVYNHQPFLRARFPVAQPEWTLAFEQPCHVILPEDEAQLRAAGARLLKEHGLEGVAFSVYRSGPIFNVYLPHFWHPRRLVYDTTRARLTLERRQFAWYEFLTHQHGRGGYQQPSVLDKVWACSVDLVCVALLVWVATGLYLWWQLPMCRRAGLVALLGGVAAFAVFLLKL